ncbi:MAG: tRNA uridine-5-carboxymethylaminomethyl(34) synthesis GTPase MnmE [Pseudomonadota bacterium]
MDTIFALSSGGLPSGVAIIRVSGPGSRFAIETITDVPCPARVATLAVLRDPKTAREVDRGLILWFPGPNSFTGEDCAEFHLHGGPAVVSAMYGVLDGLEGLRIAEAGEFSKRAFENGKLDLTEIEGLADLISAETSMQREIAFRQYSGALRETMEDWRSRVIRLRAMVEADLDFSDEEDVPGSVADNVWEDAGSLSSEMSKFLDDDNRGEIVRVGFQIVLLGKPNSGKSSLINALAKRDVAIVSDEAGTTRDLLEAHLDLSGYPVTIVDTAGIREAAGKVEQEGVRRARERASRANLVLWLTEGKQAPESVGEAFECPVLHFNSKDDAGEFGESGISVISENGLDNLIDSVTKVVRNHLGSLETAPITRERHRSLLKNCANQLARACGAVDAPIEIRAEYLREAGYCLGRITGAVDVEDLLDVIFSEFCVGK